MHTLNNYSYTVLNYETFLISRYIACYQIGLSKWIEFKTGLFVLYFIRDAAKGQLIRLLNTN
jgi:hypothetical protein